MLKKPILGVLVLVLAVGVALAAAGSGTGTAQAQAPHAPDLVLDLETDSLTFTLTVTNFGRQTARDIQVKLTSTPVIPSSSARPLRISPANLSPHDPQLVQLDVRRGILHVKSLRPGGSRSIELGTTGPFTRTLIHVRAEVISSFPKEPQAALDNNVATTWVVHDTFTGTADGNTSVQVRVSDRFPDPGDSVSFKIRLENNNGERYDRGWGDQIQLRVKVSLSPGMELVSFNPPANTRFDQATGVWHAGTLKGHRTASPRPENKEATVTVKYNGNSPIPAGEHCLTAELVHVLPEEDYPDTDWRIRDNHRHVCLGDDLPVLFQGGSNSGNRSDLDLFRVHDCVGRTAYPCNQDDTLELVAGMHERELLREDIGIGRVDDELVPGLNNYVLLQPESIVLQVGDT